MVIEDGTIKVVWISKSGIKIYSQMFDSLAKARKFGEKKRDYLIFKLMKHKKMKEFEWKILPYGNADFYINLIKIHRKHGLDKIQSFLKDFF